MSKYRLHIEATITPLEEHFDVIGRRETWLVSHASADFDFETSESLHNFVESFGGLLGACE